MSFDWTNVWLLVISSIALAGWWLTLRPRPVSRGVSTTMSTLIVVMAILLCVLAFNGQYRAFRPPPATAAASTVP